MNVKQNTIEREVTISGKGLHTGVEVKLTFKPAPEDFGFKFKRIDIDGHPVIDANVSKVKGTSRGTVLKDGDIVISTIEHVMAALIGMGVDNVLIELNGPEAPILDGSAAAYVKILGEAGLVSQNADREYFEIKRKIVYRNAETGTELIAYPDDDFSVDVMISYNSAVLANQYASYNYQTPFAQEIAPCRTFVFVRELRCF